ncbi:MAG: IPExxxVDY family protein [Flavobacteriales bacterium]|nr:IPExxxVDY family protein [Flavobacteriales bacterium]MBK9287432.1 IPExxxVDY family protein [Flavobacteriales bacterium]MBL0036246.1 IPExxxVDY family protein [Flavobacteriales bacterium]
MAKYRLDEPVDPEVMLVGISSHVNDYRLCWALNRQLGINLVRREQDIVEPGARTEARFAVFDHTDADSNARFTLVNNHGDDAILVKEQRMADFFLVVDQAAALDAPTLLAQVRESEFVLTAFPLQIQDLRAGHKLLQ